MRSTKLFRPLLLALFGLFVGFSPLTFAQAVTLQEQVQVQASRVTSSLMLLRGEGFQKKHQDALETDLQALAAAVQSLPQSSDALRSAHQELVLQIRRGVAFGPNEEDLPWRYMEELSKALLGVLHEARQLSAPGDSELAAQLEYLSVQYLSRAYLGSFEIAREQTATYLGQDERKIVPAVDAQLAALDAKADPQVGKLKTRWDYLKAALVDLNSQSSALQSASGRPFAPITVYRHTRSLTTQWMAMY
jgi:outer membrane murein-binding lipoprotein Lpp